MSTLPREEAEKRFLHDIRDHEIDIQLDDGLNRVIKCSRPKSWVFGFYIISSPGSIYMYGDMGSLGVERLPDMFEFVSDSAGDLSYFLSKAPRDFITKEYSSDLADEFMNKHIYEQFPDEEDKEKIEQLKEDLSCSFYEETKDEFYRILYESNLNFDCEFPEVDSYTYHTIWKVEAMKWAVKKYYDQKK
jgi:hypothetical protein